MVVKSEFKKKLTMKAGHFTPLTLVLVSSTLVSLSLPSLFFPLVPSSQLWMAYSIQPWIAHGILLFNFTACIAKT